MLSRFGESGAGDVSPLHGEWQGCHRLRCGDHRVIFRRIEDGLEIIAVGHRSDSHLENARLPCHITSARGPLYQRAHLALGNKADPGCMAGRLVVLPDNPSFARC